MLSHLFFSLRRRSVLMGVALAFVLGSGFFLGAPGAQATTCNCECAAIRVPGTRSASSCAACPAACDAYCGQPEALPSVATCGLEPTTPSPAPSTPSPSAGSSRTRTPAPTGGAGAATGGGTQAGDTAAGAATQGACVYNCSTPHVTTCTSNADCVTACNTNCPNLVSNSTCATNPAPRCAPAGSDGQRTCVFECQVSPPDACTVGDAGNSACGSRSAQICRPPAGSTGAAPTIAVSTTVQPRCLDPHQSNSAATNGSDTNSNGDSSGSSSSAGSFPLTNPIRGANTIPAIIGKAVRAVMGLVGAIALLMFVLGGVRWILAAGDSKQTQAASDMLKNATIGLLIIFLSYTVITVGMGLVNNLSSQGDTTSSGGVQNSGSSGSGAGSTTNSRNGTGGTGGTAPTPPAAGSVASCNAAYPARPFLRGDCSGCQASCTNILCRVNATDASSDPAPPPTDARNVNTAYRFPGGLSAVTSECLTRCRASADCPSS